MIDNITLRIDDKEVRVNKGITVLEAAQAAGMKCIVVKGENNQHLHDKAHGIIENYHEAEEVLKKI